MTAQEDTKISSLMRQIMLKKQIYVNHELEVAHGGLTAHQVMALMYIHRNPGIIQREIVTLRTNCQIKCNFLPKKTSDGVFQTKTLRGR
ncbi:hypothetical protein EFS17_11945, partial [Levilactobacillus brevis]